MDFMRRQRKAPNCAGLVQRCGTMVTPGDARTAPRLYRFFLLASSLRFIQIQGSRIEPNPPLGSSPCCPLPRYALWSGAIFVRPALRAPCCHPNHAWLFFFFLGRGGGEGTRQGRAPTAPPRTPTKRRRCPGAWKDLEGSGGSGREPCEKDFPRGKGTFEAPVTQPWEPGVSGRVLEGRPETVASC